MFLSWKWHKSLCLSFLCPELIHMVTLQGSLGIVFHRVLRKKGSPGYTDTEVYGELSEWKKSGQLLTLGKTNSCTRIEVK